MVRDREFVVLDSDLHTVVNASKWVCVFVVALSCGGATTDSSPGPADAGLGGDQNTDTSDSSVAPPDTFHSDVGGNPDACSVPDDTACVSATTGCASTGRCTAVGFVCRCAECDRVIEDGSCSVTIEDPKVTLARTVVNVIGTDSGKRFLPVKSQAACLATEGYSVDVVPGKVTITLCPASCTEHRSDPALTFTITRSGCPIMAPYE